jgi:signal transduction histidine kinase
MSINYGLRRRLARTIVAQLLAIAVAAVFGIWATAFTIENVLIKQALADEADYYWELAAKKPDARVPDTRNLTGYLAQADNDAHVPIHVRNLGIGFHSVPSEFDLSVVNISERGSDRLVLIFEGQQVRELSVLFGLVPLALVLMVVYVGAWLSYRSTRRAISPVEWLARQVNKLDPKRPDPHAFALSKLPVAPDSEVIDLANALGRLTQRVNVLVDREREFTRDVSHELRSPLTVVQMAADVLLRNEVLDQSARKSVERIKRASSDMVELVEAFLLLAREGELGLEFEPVCVNDVVAEEIERTRVLVSGRPVTLTLTQDSRMLVETSERVLSSMLGNLIRNAADYTEAGEVRVHIRSGVVEIHDEGPGMDSHEVGRAFEAFYRGRSTARGGSSGYGVGLTIVRRLSDRFDWPLAVDSTPGVGTSVLVRFPKFEEAGQAD